MFARLHNRLPKKDGFTIVEMLVIAPIVILTIGAFITVIVNMTGEVLATRSANVLAYDIQDALARIEEDVKLSTTFLAQTNISPLTSPQGIGNDSTPFQNVDTTNGDALVLNTLATTGNPLLNTSSLIYLINKPNACSSTLLTQNNPMATNIVYFVKTDNGVSSLWRRMISTADYTTAGCSAPWQQPSCNPTYMTTNPGSSTFCKTQDIKLVDYVNPSDFSIEYFSTPDATLANTVASDTACTPIDSAPCVAARNAALETTTTVSASINVSKKVGGRDITQSGTIRATKLDINASTIAPVTVTTVPDAPTVSVALSQPVSGVFTWPTVAGATGYTFQYNTTGGSCSSGSWTTGFTNQNTTSFTASGTHNGTLYGCAQAINSAGTSAWSTMTSLSIPLWTNFVLQNNWIDYSTSSWATAAYTKTSSGLVVLKGLIKSGTAGTTVATLPPGYRPSQNLLFTSIASSANARIDVLTNGNVNIANGSGDLSLESVRFMPLAAGSFTNVAPPFYNGWTTYNDSNYIITPRYNQDSSGRVNLEAMIASGTSTDGTTMFIMPAGLRPTLYAHLPASVCGNYGVFALDQNSTGEVEAKGGSNCWHSLHTIYYPASRASGGTYNTAACTTQWCNLPLVNSWIYYGSPFSLVEYTKGSDNMVSLKGLIRAGTTTGDTIMATLPSGYRPAQRLLIPIVSSGALGRLDILPDGTIRFEIGNNGWLSLDNIIFMADGN